MIGIPGHFRTQFPLSVSEKEVVGLLLRRRTLYPAELWMHTTYGDCEKYPSIIIREKKGKVNSF